MGRYVIRRIIQMIPLFLGISIIIFLIIQAAPGGPEMALLQTGRFVNPEILAAYRARLGLDQPIVVQYFRWLGAALTGDLGYSYTSAQPVLTMILERLPATIELMLSAYLLAAVIALPLGVYSAIHKYSVLDYFGTGLSFLGIAMPVFWFGLILQLVFAVQLGWFPSFGRGETVQVGWWTTGFLTAKGWHHLVLPAVTLAIFQLALIMRLVRAEMLEVLRADYIKFARARGLSNRAIHFGHALKNTLVPVMTITGLQLGGLIAFAIITETVFQWPGMGLLFIQAVTFADIPVMAAYLCLIALIFVVINLVVDLLYFAVDPRLRVSGKGGGH